MKKLSILFLFAFFFLATSVTFAQEVEEEVVEQVQEMTEVAVADLPDTVKKTLDETYAGYEVKKVEKTSGDLPKYQATLSKDGKSIKVTMDSSGKVLEQKDIES